ncbi:polynucleotide kinase-phosphatase [Pseudomarimonas arenosa]|uniref:Polynucleotide kinase-phosphatase n=1 Tax=Pseudomarimonas arenosa TaxID=2774145 RepID=A0AAW3ZG22_9GAMM|nr:polynucleotide kinase-phosphatase [Pseudomarimonas arenosa]MBD8524274.1 polynucleotide kinase-phosphatase [Pseudomarimonas arenosa]
MSTIRIPKLSLVALIGASGSGKSSFARRHFLPSEVISSDCCRALVSDDENDQSASKDAFDVLYYIAGKRLAAGRLTVIDATNVRPEDRKRLVALAREYHVLPVAIVFDLPERVCHERNEARSDRDFGPHVIRNQMQSLHRSMRGLEREGFRNLTVLRRVDEVEAASIERQGLWNDKRDQHGPFDIIGDIHGCLDETVELLDKLGYRVGGSRGAPEVIAPEGRRAIFVGDLVDRGPDSPGVLRLVMHMVGTGAALCVPGNHDVKLLRKLRGKNVRISHGLAETLEQLEREPAEFRTQVAEFIDKLVSHYVLDDGKLVVAHAGLKQSLQGRASGAVRAFALYGETTGETDEYGLPVRYDWASDYRGEAMVVYGHTPVPQPEWVNRTICIDTGCVFGGELTALRYPERELVAVPAARMYYQPVRPLQPESPAPQRDGHVLDIEDVLGKRLITPRLGRNITIREENARAALEVMSRFAADPRWLIYLPPTMSPPATAPDGDLLERPEEAFAYYRNEGISQLVCQEKHMGSRAVIVLCRDTEVAARRFGIGNDGRGVIYTRTGRRFFNREGFEEQLLARLDAALERAGLWQALGSDWIALDTELLPWSAKAEELLRTQYAPTGAAAMRSVATAVDWLRQAEARGLELNELATSFRSRQAAIARYVDEYRRYCWPVESVDDLKIAPFHILAHEGAATLGRDHRWHLEHIDRLVGADSRLFRPTARRFVDLDDAHSVAAASDWWHTITAGESEGMVVKPLESVVSTTKGLIQPAIKVRGREYLRIIYGPTYTEPLNLERLRQRGLNRKRGLALREFVLGYEALHRFVEREGLYRVHECVFGVLALESEPVDPRL